ncbi:MAG: hypothetical protein LRY51_00395, partial [Geovibrio sp.]|nr:hypothetical protein [Geovibrio sp.]
EALTGYLSRHALVANCRIDRKSFYECTDLSLGQWPDSAPRFNMENKENDSGNDGLGAAARFGAT